MLISGLLEVVEIALLQCVIISLFLTLVLLISQMINAEMWLNGYPPDVCDKYGERRKKAWLHRVPSAIAFFEVIIITPSIGGLLILRATPNEPIFFSFHLRLYRIIHAAFVIIPGTEGTN
jgi:hypothetical protein